VTLLFFCAV